MVNADNSILTPSIIIVSVGIIANKDRFLTRLVEILGGKEALTEMTILSI